MYFSDFNSRGFSKNCWSVKRLTLTRETKMSGHPGEVWGKILMIHSILFLPGAGLFVGNLSQQWEVTGHMQNYMGESKVSTWVHECNWVCFISHHERSWNSARSVVPRTLVPFGRWSSLPADRFSWLGAPSFYKLIDDDSSLPDFPDTDCHLHGLSVFYSVAFPSNYLCHCWSLWSLGLGQVYSQQTDHGHASIPYKSPMLS